MGAFLFLAVGIFFGYCLCQTAFPGLCKCGLQTFDKKPLSMSSLFIQIPAYVLAGLIPLTSVTYLNAYLLKVVGKVERPLLAANIIAILLFLMSSFLLLFFSRKKSKEKTETVKISVIEWVLLLFVIVLSFLLMFKTFSVADGKMYVGLSVFSDFAPHLGMIRSFSFGNNFPTSYSHFAGEDIRYHFLFQFMVGNLEFLGMRIDYAFNLPSIFGLVSTCMLLYALAVRLTGKKLVGFFTTIFFLFRSSPSFFKYLADLPKGQLVKQLVAETNFLACTPNEDWGLWNLNVYCNQRHFAFAIAVMLLSLHFFLPYLYEMAEKLNKKRESMNADENSIHGFKRFLGYTTEMFFTKEAFSFQHPVQAILLGVLLGLLAFFNGAVLTATCLVLFFMAACSNRRLDYLLTAGIAFGMSILEASFFIRGNAVSPKLLFGFIAEKKTFFGVMEYLVALTGILLLCVLIYLFLGKGVKRYLIVPFIMPLVMAFTVSLTVDVTVNHKYIMLSVMLLSLYPAILVNELIEKESTLQVFHVVGRRIAAALLIVALTITGLFEAKIVLQKNQKKTGFIFEMNDPLLQWMKENVTSDDIILSSYYHIHRVVLGGGMLYYGWPYYAWSAGYDTSYRERQVSKMFQASSVDWLKKQIEENNIRFIIVDHDARENPGYYLREDVISAAYEPVYTEGENEWKFTIYDTGKPVIK